MTMQDYLTAQRDHASRQKVASIKSQLANGTYDVDGKLDQAVDLIMDSHVLTKAASLCAVDEKRIERRRAEWDRDNAQDTYDGGRLSSFEK